MGTRLETHIYRSLAQQRFVNGLDRCKGIHFGMSLTTTHMISLTDDTATMHYHRPHHRIGTGVVLSAGRKLQTSAHIFFVFRYSVHSSSSKENKILYPADTEYHRFSVYLHTQ